MCTSGGEWLFEDDGVGVMMASETCAGRERGFLNTRWLMVSGVAVARRERWFRWISVTVEDGHGRDCKQGVHRSCSGEERAPGALGIRLICNKQAHSSLRSAM